MRFCSFPNNGLPKQFVDLRFMRKSSGKLPVGLPERCTKLQIICGGRATLHSVVIGFLSALEPPSYQVLHSTFSRSPGLLTLYHKRKESPRPPGLSHRSATHSGGSPGAFLAGRPTLPTLNLLKGSGAFQPLHFLALSFGCSNL